MHKNGEIVFTSKPAKDIVVRRQTNTAVIHLQAGGMARLADSLEGYTGDIKIYLEQQAIAEMNASNLANMDEMAIADDMALAGDRRRGGP